MRSVRTALCVRTILLVVCVGSVEGVGRVGSGEGRIGWSKVGWGGGCVCVLGVRVCVWEGGRIGRDRRGQ